MNRIDQLIRNAHIVTDGSDFDGWVGIDRGQIQSLGSPGQEPPASRTIDAGGSLLMPGRIEPHCHLRAGMFENDIATVSREAVAGGVTTIMPYMRTTESYLDTIPAWEQAIRDKSHCDVALHLQIQAPEHLHEIRSLYKDFGVQSFKLHSRNTHRSDSRRKQLRSRFRSPAVRCTGHSMGSALNGRHPALTQGQS